MNPATNFKVHFANITGEVLKNPGTQILRIPMMLLRDTMHKIGARASAINDAELNSYMAQLAIYSVCDPEDKIYNAQIATETLEGKHGVDAAKMLEKYAVLKNIADHARQLSHAMKSGDSKMKLSARMKLDRALAEL